MRTAIGITIAAVAIGLAGPACAQEGTPAESKMEKKEMSPLLMPASEQMTQTAPDVFSARFETSKGDFVIEVTREWSPRGADRFYNLVKNGFFDDCRFFRVVSGFMVQFGLNGDPKVNGAWRPARIKDDPVKQSNTRGMVTYAMGGPNTRTTQVFINFKDNARLDGMGFSPFGKVTSGMTVVDSLYADYGESVDMGGRGPSQGQIQGKGNAYLNEGFPELDYIKKATIVE